MEEIYLVQKVKGAWNNGASVNMRKNKVQST